MPGDGYFKRPNYSPQPGNQSGYDQQLSPPSNVAYSDYKTRYERAMSVQAVLEDDVSSLNSALATKSSEVSRLRKEKHQTESDIAEVTKELINVQTKWIEQTDSLTTEINQLKLEVDAFKKKSARQAHLIDAQSHKLDALERAKVRAQQPLPPTPRSCEENHDQLLMKELLALHEKYKTELSQVTEVNERLQKENESIQLLLAEKTITSSLSLADELGSLESFEGSDEGEPQTPTSPSMAEPDEPDETIKRKYAEQTKELHRLRFAVHSLENHNKALRTSLENLVQRLLQDPSFSKSIGESIGARAVVSFSNRIASGRHTDNNVRVAPPHGTSARSSRLHSAAQWTNALFNSVRTGDPSRRTISLGIDEEAPCESGSLERVATPLDSATKPQTRSPTESTFSTERTISLGNYDSPLHIRRARPTSMEGQAGLKQLHLA